MRRWQCCHAVGGRRKTRLEEEGAEGAVLGELEVDDWTRGGGRTTQGKRAADDCTSQQEGGGARRSWWGQQRW